MPLPNKDPHMFMVACPRDTMITPFQCEFCLFQNLKARDPVEGISWDNYLLAMLRRAKLDAIWARQHSPVERSVIDLNRLCQTEVGFGILTSIPRRGPFPLEDTFREGLAACILQWFLDLEKNAPTIQYNTA